MIKRSNIADKYSKIYSTKQLGILRGTILTRDHYRCQRCGVSLTSGKSQPTSAVVHHKKPHKGKLKLFYDPSNLEVVCWSCHSDAMHWEEVLGYDTIICADGWPVDERKFPTIIVKKHDKKFSNIGQPRVCCSPLG